MNYFKSVLVGLAAVFLICIFVPTLPTIVRILIFAMNHGGEGGIAGGSVRWHAPSFAQCLFMFVVFGGGFVWELRRLTKRRLPPVTDSTDPPIS